LLDLLDYCLVRSPLPWRSLIACDLLTQPLTLLPATVVNRSDCSWWGVSASCPRRRSDDSDFSKVGIFARHSAGIPMSLGVPFGLAPAERSLPDSAYIRLSRNITCRKHRLLLASGAREGKKNTLYYPMDMRKAFRKRFLTSLQIVFQWLPKCPLTL